MGKAKRKINRLKRSKMKKKIKIRIKVAPPGFSMKTKKDYDRKNNKHVIKEELNG